MTAPCLYTRNMPLSFSQHTPKSIAPIYIAAILAAFVMVCIALSIGRFAISPAELFSLFGTKIFGGIETATTAPASADTVLFAIRLPRVVAAFAVGAALAAAGAAYQNLFRNPLVSPDILGVSSGAALGAVVAIFFGLPLLVIQGAAFAGGLVAVMLIVSIGRIVRGGDTMLALVLTGVVVGSLFAAGVALAKYLADPYNQLPAITYWLLGSFAGVTNNDLAIALPMIIIALVPLLLLRWRINLLSLGEDDARALGFNLAATRLIVIAAATLMTAAAVAICGIIGWVGLVIPHAVRLLVGAEFSRLLPLTLIIGGTFMLLVDTVGRVIAPIEIPPGVLTTVIGTPAFIWLMRLTYRRREG